MRIIELVGTCLTVEFSDEDLTELSEDFGVTLPGRFIRIPGWLTDVFSAYADEVSVSKHASGAFHCARSTGRAELSSRRDDLLTMAGVRHVLRYSLLRHGRRTMVLQ